MAPMKELMVRQTVDRAGLGKRGATDVNKINMKFSLPTTVGVLEPRSHHLNRNEILLQILPEIRDNRYSSLSLLPGPCQGILS